MKLIQEAFQSSVNEYIKNYWVLTFIIFKHRTCFIQTTGGEARCILYQKYHNFWGFFFKNEITLLSSFHSVSDMEQYSTQSIQQN